MSNLIRGVTPLLASALVAGCSTVSVGPGPLLSSTPARSAAASADGATSLSFQQQAFAHAMKLSMDEDVKSGATAEDKRAAGARLFSQGKAYLDLVCSAYLDQLGAAQQRMANERKQLGIVATFAAAAMGLTGSPAKHIAGAATGFGASEASMDAFAVSYLFADASAPIRRLVESAQSAYLQSLGTRVTALEHHEAMAVLTGYESQCRPSQIRSLVNEAIGKAQVVADPPVTNLQVQAAVLKVLDDLKSLNVGDISESQAILLYAWLTLPAARTNVESVEPLVKLLTPTPDEAKRTALSARLNVIFAPLALDGNPVLQRWQGALARFADKQPDPKALLPLAVPQVRVGS